MALRPTLSSGLPFSSFYLIKRAKISYAKYKSKKDAKLFSLCFIYLNEYLSLTHWNVYYNSNFDLHPAFSKIYPPFVSMKKHTIL
jgi:hypothetical protein